MRSGRKTILTSGHPEPLSDVSLPTQWLEIEALVSNSPDSAVYVGGKNVHARVGGEMGTRLNTNGIGGDRITFNEEDLANVWIDAQNDGEGVSFTYG